jgi:hypothetical protein
MSRPSRSKIWSRGATALSTAAILALWIHGCGPTPPRVPEGGGEPPTQPVDCAAAADVELLLADLVPTAAVGYGRIDPFLYEVDPAGAIHIVSSAVPKDKAASEAALELLELVNGNRVAQEIFRNNIARSQRACAAAKCPGDAVYEILQLEPAPADAALETFTYSFGARVPSEAEQNTFLELMAVPSNPQCKRVTDVRFDGNLFRVASLTNDCHSSANGHTDDLGDPCTTTSVPSGVWEKRDLSPKRPRHCCISK